MHAISLLSFLLIYNVNTEICKNTILCVLLYKSWSLTLREGKAGENDNEELHNLFPLPNIGVIKPRIIGRNNNNNNYVFFSKA
jgi:hypothetical protein